MTQVMTEQITTDNLEEVRARSTDLMHESIRLSREVHLFEVENNIGSVHVYYAAREYDVPFDDIIAAIDAGELPYTIENGAIAEVKRADVVTWKASR